jgi:hypothetical protein
LTNLQSSSSLHRHCGPTPETNLGGSTTVGLSAPVGLAPDHLLTPDPSPEVLQRELESIKELHDEEPDSKCA